MSLATGGPEPESPPPPEPGPCEGCARAPRCAAEKLACSAYAAFLACRPHWDVLPRADASRERYRRVMGESSADGA